MTQQSLCLNATALPAKNKFRALKMVQCILKDIMNVSRQRHALGQMTDRQLQDIGLSHVEAQQEASRPFWDLPT